VPRLGSWQSTRAVYCPLCLRPSLEKGTFCPVDGERLVAPRARGALATQETELMGLVVGERYRIRGYVNSGATARVYLAEDLRSHEPVVVKLFAPPAARAEEIRSRFAGEAQMAMSLSHPNVVKFLDAGELPDGRPYLVLEALHGETLGDFLRRQGPMPVDTALRLVRHAAAGLAAAHRAGIVHRDVKPDNLFLLGPLGEPYGLKVIDFGMAKSASGSTQTKGLLLGTVQYMAPEQIVADEVDARTDVYGLGVVMFRMFTGHLPYETELHTDLLAHQLFSPIPPPSWLSDTIDPRIEAVIVTAMRKHPANRYESMERLLEDIDRLLRVRTGEPTPRSMTRIPDVYEAVSVLAREASELLETKFRAG
jgi:eukaryotic-like serine/threonine-protein kinase